MTWSSTATRGRTGPRRPLGEPGGFGSLTFSIPLGFRTGRPFSPLSRAISARWAATVCSRDATLPSNRTTSAFRSVGESASRSPGGAILPGNQRQARHGSKNRSAATGFAAVTTLLYSHAPADVLRRCVYGWTERDAVLGDALPRGRQRRARVRLRPSLLLGDGWARMVPTVGSIVSSCPLRFSVSFDTGRFAG